MEHVILKAFLAAGLPVVVLLGGDRLMSRMTGRVAALSQSDGEQQPPEPLTHWWVGYSREAAKKYWSWLKPAGRQAEEKFLTLDLLFPFLYGGALAASLWWVWMTLGQPFHPAWIVAPLAMILTADWTENLIQLAQLRHYLSSDEARIQDLCIQVSNCATIIKLWLTSGLYVSLVGLVIKMVFMLSHRQLAADVAE